MSIYICTVDHFYMHENIFRGFVLSSSEPDIVVLQAVTKYNDGICEKLRK